MIFRVLFTESWQMGVTAPAEVEQLYSELRRMAARFMGRERSGHTLQATALANEAALSLGMDYGKWDRRAHYFGAAARAMRRVLVQHARARLAQKRGCGAERVTLEDLHVPALSPATDALALTRALEELGERHPFLRTIVEMRYYDGMSLEEVAEATGYSPARVKREWAEARAWLRRYLTS
jgi:RNA polymerase sigma factor (TIGR02999 family)